MVAGSSVLSLLADSVDWLKDSDGLPLSEYRLRVTDKLGTCWRHPEEDERFTEFEQALVTLFQALFFNKLYPEGLFFVHDSPADPKNFLPRPDRLDEDVPKLEDFCVTNRLGMGELHVLYIMTLLYRRLFKDPNSEVEISIEQTTGQWLRLEKKEHQRKNTGPFSLEALQRFRSLRGMRVVLRRNLDDAENEAKLTVEERLALLDDLVETGSSGMSRFCPKDKWLALLVLEFCTAMEEHVRARHEERLPRESRGTEEVAKGLLHCLKEVTVSEEAPPPAKARLSDLLLTVMVRAMGTIEPRVGVRIYTKIRSHSGRRPRVNHKAMFEAVATDEDRMRLVNFLYREGERNPYYYIRRFGDQFEFHDLRFASKEEGFKLKLKSVG